MVETRQIARPVDALLARARLATEAIEPPPADFAARVLAATSRPRAVTMGATPPNPRSRLIRELPTSSWAQLGPMGRRVMPFAAAAAAAAMALAWSADDRLDDSAASAIDIAQGLP